MTKRTPKPRKKPAAASQQPTAARRREDVLYIETADNLRDPFVIDALRRALVVVTDDPVVVAQVERDCRIKTYSERLPLSSINLLATDRRQQIDANQRVAVIIPNYNYERFVGEAIESVLNQTRPPDEIIIVDDASTDGSIDRIYPYLIGRAEDAPLVRLIQHETNRGNVGAARNTGIAATDAQYVVCLDSDDLIEPAYIETCLRALQADQGIGVVYTGVQTLEQQDGDNHRKIWTDWPIPFNWAWMAENHIPFNTCIPTASMYRREFWRRAGGYDEGIASAEDLEFWTRALSCGWTAVKCTPDPLFVYRRHGPSMTSTRKQTNVAVWNRVYSGFKALAAPTGEPPVLRDYTRPAISVVIPCGPNHAGTLTTAIASVLAQTFDRWEIVVVNDSGGPLPLSAYPFVREVAGPRAGVAAARNAGVAVASAPLLMFLDADDLLMPDALARMLARYAQGDAGYVYSGWWYAWQGRPAKAVRADDYDRAAWVRADDAGGLHGVGVLIARADLDRIGGFDEDVTPGFEDRELFARAAIFGVCGAAIPDPLYVYRWHAGTMRESANLQSGTNVALMQRRYGPFLQGERQMASCCVGNAAAVDMAREILNNDIGQAFNQRNAPAISDAPMMIYTGPRAAGVPYFNRYEGWRGMDPIKVDPADVERLQSTGVWELVDTFPHTPQPANIYDGPVVGNGETLVRQVVADLDAGSVQSGDYTTLNIDGNQIGVILDDSLAPDEIRTATPEQVDKWRQENGWLTPDEVKARGGEWVK